MERATTRSTTPREQAIHVGCCGVSQRLKGPPASLLGAICCCWGSTGVAGAFAQAGGHKNRFIKTNGVFRSAFQAATFIMEAPERGNRPVVVRLGVAGWSFDRWAGFHWRRACLTCCCAIYRSGVQLRCRVARWRFFRLMASWGDRHVFWMLWNAPFVITTFEALLETFVR